MHLPMVIMHISCIIVGRVNLHSNGNSNVMEGMQSGDDNAWPAGGKRKGSGNSCQMSQVPSVNAVAGPSHPERQRRPTKRPDADIPTPSPKRRRK